MQLIYINMIYKYVFVKRSMVCKAIEKSKNKCIQVKNHEIEKIIIIHNNVYTMVGGISWFKYLFQI